MAIVNGSEFVKGWTVAQTLGEGAFGEVQLLVNDADPNVCVAVKVIDLNRSKDVLNSVRKEAMILDLVKNHRNIIGLLGHNDDLQAGLSFIFLEYADGGELFDRIEPDVGMPSERAQFFFRQLISGVEYLHTRGIAHRDLKPENILLTLSDQLKISDFGMATVFRAKGKERKCNSRCGTMPYVAPEVISQKEYLATPVDVWSCGVVLVAMLAGELCWDRPTDDCVQFANWKQKTHLDHGPWNKLGNLSLSFVRNILHFCVEQRYTIKKIKEHRWFNKNFKTHSDGLSRVNSVGNENARPLKRKHPDRLELLKSAENELSRSQPVSNGSVREISHLTDTCFGITTTGEDCDRSLTPGLCGGNDTSMVSFSQPAALDQLLLSTQTRIGCSQSQASQTLNPLQKLVRRMTRFAVNISCADALTEICDVCTASGYAVKQTPPSSNQLSVTTEDRRRCILVIKVSVFEMGNKVLVDFRRSKGDGLEFKRIFLSLKGKLARIVCCDSVEWLRQHGLVIGAEPIDNSMQRLSLEADLHRNDSTVAEQKSNVGELLDLKE